MKNGKKKALAKRFLAIFSKNILHQNSFSRKSLKGGYNKGDSDWLFDYFFIRNRRVIKHLLSTNSNLCPDSVSCPCLLPLPPCPCAPVSMCPAPVFCLCCEIMCPTPVSCACTLPVCHVPVSFTYDLSMCPPPVPCSILLCSSLEPCALNLLHKYPKNKLIKLGKKQ